MIQFEVHIVKFSGALFEFCLLEVFKRVSKKYMMSWFMNIFDPIFGMYGTFMTYATHLWTQKCLFVVEILS